MWNHDSSNFFKDKISLTITKGMRIILVQTHIDHTYLYGLLASSNADSIVKTSNTFNVLFMLIY